LLSPWILFDFTIVVVCVVYTALDAGESIDPKTSTLLVRIIRFGRVLKLSRFSAPPSAGAASLSQSSARRLSEKSQAEHNPPTFFLQGRCGLRATDARNNEVH
jgi:hypothetical protein